MAAGTILTVLTNIPWRTVVENAPKLADGAAKLWNSASRRNKPDPIPGAVDAPQQQPASEAEQLANRLQAAEEGVRQLTEQMQASSALIKDLAEQNTLLIQRIELNRLRLIRLSTMGAAIGAVLLGLNLFLVFTR